MEEDIKILENILKTKEYGLCETTDTFYTALENLLTRYKQLEEENKEFYEGEMFTAKQLKNIEQNQKKYFINKQVVKEKIEELETKKKEYGFGSIESMLFLNKIQVLQELLEREGK